MRLRSLSYKNLDSYYQAFNLHAEMIDHYEGPTESALTLWLEYYSASMAQSCEAALHEIAACIASSPTKKRRKRKKI
jgi:hypothetical protein